MKSNKNQIIIWSVLLIILLLIIWFFIIWTDGDDSKDTIISLQDEKIKLLEDKLNNQWNKDNWDETENKLKNQENWDELEDNSLLLWDGEESLWRDLNISKMYDDAIGFMEKEEFNKSVNIFKTIIELESDSSDIYENLAYSYIELKDYDNAIDIYKILIEKHPDNYIYYEELSFVYDYNNQEKESIIFFIASHFIEWSEYSDLEFDTKEGTNIYNLEQETLNEFVNNKEYDDLRRYIFNKYLGVSDSEFDIENQNIWIDDLENNNNLDLDNNSISNNEYERSDYSYEELNEIYKLAVKKAQEWNDLESTILYKKYLSLSSSLIDWEYLLWLTSGAWNNLWFNYDWVEGEHARIVCFMVTKALGTRNDQTLNATENQKKIIELEQETINEFVNNKEYDDLRKYIFNKYLWEPQDEYNIVNNDEENDEEAILKQLFDEGKVFEKNKEYKKAIEKYLEFIEINENYPNVYHNIWNNYIGLKEFQKTIEFYKKSLLLNSDNPETYPEIYSNLSIILYDLNKIESATFFYIVNKVIKNINIDYDNWTDLEKKIVDLEYERIKKFIADKKFDELRDYAFEKYLD